MVFSGVLWLVFWAAVMYVIVTLVSESRSRPQPAPPRPHDPMDIVKRRYAAGEISREEFQQLRDDLTGVRSQDERETI